MKDIQVEELHSKMLDSVFMEDAQLIDVREPDEMYVPFISHLDILFLLQLMD